MYRFLFLGLIVIASAEVVYEGPCPDVKPQDDFDFHSYQGTWYEMARYPNAGEGGAEAKCTIIEYLRDGNRNKVQYSQVIDGVRSFIAGDLTFYPPAKLMMSFTFRGVTKNNFYSILDTDYQSYAIGYSCSYYPKTNTHRVYSWILSRTPSMNEYANPAINNYLSQSKVLDGAKYITNDYSPEACYAPIITPITKFL